MSERPPPESRNHHAFNQHAAHHHGPGHSKKPCSRIKLYNLGYFFSLSGLMALCEIILGMTIYALLWDSSNELDKFLVTVSFLQWMTGLYIHATIAFCAAGARIRSLLLYLLHHGVGAILYLGGAVTTLVSSMYTQSDDIIRTASSLALAASALHLVQATRYLLKQRPEGDRGDVGEDVTAGILVETRIARFKSSRATPVPAPAVPIRRESIAVPLTGVITFALAYCSRIYVYQLSRLVVRAEPDPSVVYVIIVSFLYWFVSLLVLTSALLSSTGLLVTSTFFYVLFQAFGLVFYLSGGISLLALETSQSVAIAAGVFATISAVLHGLHSVLVYMKRKK